MALNVVVFTGSTRTEGPPLVLGPRVGRFIVQTLERRGHAVTWLDPRVLSLPLLQRTEFSYPRSEVPDKLTDIRQQLASADALVVVTPEYNHSPSPALLNLLDHFGSSVYSYKPSAIVSYSGGQWGGTRAAQVLKGTLSELGCLPVSAMIHIPKVQEVLKEDGTPIENVERWESYTDRCFSQLEWWGEAAKKHRAIASPVLK